jgi:hypothetical protein
MSEINIFSELNFRYILGTLIVLVFAARPLCIFITNRFFITFLRALAYTYLWPCLWFLNLEHLVSTWYPNDVYLEEGAFAGLLLGMILAICCLVVSVLLVVHLCFT